MKILHCCLAAFYIDNFSYQENILPRMHKLQGHTVRILASNETYVDNIKLGYTNAGSYINEDGIQVTRVPYLKFLPHAVMKKLRIYEGITEQLEEFKPDIIYLHDCQFLSIYSFARFAKNNNVKIYIDCHTDFINSGRNWLSKYILHGIIYRHCIKKIEKYTYKFYGTLPARIDFLEDVYGVDRKNIELLPFGTDDSLFASADKEEIRKAQRHLLGYSDDDFVIVSGGKIDKRKNIHLLMEAFLELKDILNIKLLVFGKPTEEMKPEISKYSNNDNINYIEWLPSKEIFKHFLAADLAIFPGTHSVLWEEAIGLGLPAIFHKWEGMQHVDLGGNCVFIKNVNADVIRTSILELFNNMDKFNKMKDAAQQLGPKNFLYSQIAKNAIAN